MEHREAAGIGRAWSDGSALEQLNLTVQYGRWERIGPVRTHQGPDGAVVVVSPGTVRPCAYAYALPWPRSPPR
ncbi:hypothetical protein GCM10009577_37780 [Streptomyces javensis]